MGAKGSKTKKKDPFDQLQDASFEMRMQAKQFSKEAEKANKQAAAQKARAAEFLKKNDMVSAQIVAGEAVRFNKEAVNMNRMSAKMTAVSLKLDSAYRAQQISAQIKNAVPSMEKALGSMNSLGVAQNMANFEKVFEDMDVKVEGITGALDNVIGESAQDKDAVNSLLNEIAAGAGLQANLEMGVTNQNEIKMPGQQEEVKDDYKDLEKRLQALR